MDIVLGILVFSIGACLGAVLVLPFGVMAGRHKAAMEWRDAIEVARHNEARDG